MVADEVVETRGRDTELPPCFDLAFAADTVAPEQVSCDRIQPGTTRAGGLATEPS